MKLEGLKDAVRSGAASTGHTAQNVGSWFYRHVFTVLATAAIAGAFLFVPQINHVAWQVPGVTHAGVFEVVVFWAYLVFLVVLFGGLCWFSLPSKVQATDSLRGPKHARKPTDGAEPPAVAFPEGDPDEARPHGSIWRGCSWFAALLTLLAKRLDARTRTGLGVAAFVLGAIWCFLPGVGVGARFAFEDASRTALALILGLIGVWAVLFDRGRKDPSAPPHYHVAVAGRALWLMLLTYVFGEVMWYCAHGYHLAATPRAYTLWALMQFGFLMVLVARCIDTVHVYSHVNVRGWSLPLFAVCLAVVGAEPVGKQGAVAMKQVPAVDGSWFEALDARLDKIPPGPAVIVTVSGGGSRAAIFAGLVFERLSSLQVSKNATDTFSDHVVLISAVSGGSLASAYEVYTLAGAKERLLPQPRNSFHDELLARMSSSVRQMLERSSELGASNDSLAKVLEQLAKDIAAESEHDDIASPTPPGINDDVRAAVHGRFADDMATDFMAPMLRGALLPGIERGTRLCDFWRERFGWADVQNLARHDPSHPLLVLNATDNGRGVRLAIGFPSLPRGLLGETMSSLSDVAPGWALDLAQAVRLSANFPWGLQVGSIGLDDPAPEPLKWVPSAKTDHEVPHAWNLCDRSRVNVLDGGIIDNTGIDTVARLFDRLRRLEAPGDTPVIIVDPPSVNLARIREQAVSVLKKLRERKVLLVEIDAGRKFQPGGLLSSLLPTVFAPLSSLQAASHVNSLLRKQSHLAVLADALDPDDDTTRFLSVPFVCNRDEDVMTAWALGSEDKARIMVQFLAEARMQAEQLRTAFADLATETTRDQGKDKQSTIDAEAKARHERYSLNVQQQMNAAPQPPKGLPPPVIRRRTDPKGVEWRQSK